MPNDEIDRFFLKVENHETIDNLKKYTASKWNMCKNLFLTIVF